MVLVEVAVLIKVEVAVLAPEEKVRVVVNKESGTMNQCNPMAFFILK